MEMSEEFDINFAVELCDYDAKGIKTVAILKYKLKMLHSDTLSDVEYLIKNRLDKLNSAIPVNMTAELKQVRIGE